MNDSNQRSASAVVIGVGSDHGDDQLGWRVVQMLRDHPRFTQHAVEIQETTRLLDYLAGCNCLVIVDAASSGAAPGTITRLPWPNASIEIQQGSSTHGVGVADALRLADELGMLPERVVVFGVEGKDYQPADEMSAAVRDALPEVVERVIEEVEKGAESNSS